jgi:hypothetical protein
MPDGRITRCPLIALAFLGLTGCFGSSTAVVFHPRVWFVEPANNALVTNPVRVVFGLQSMVVRPSGDRTPDSGHHHLIIDRAPIAAGQLIPFDEPGGIFHYGDNPPAVVAYVPLPPGNHSLTAQFADYRHKVYGGLLTTTIQVTVVPPLR